MNVGVLFLAAVLAEVASLVLVGSWLGALPSFGLLALGFVLGFTILRNRGVATVQSAMTASQRGESVTPALLDNALMALAGILLVIPGFLSDVIALALLVPPVRALIGRRVTARVKAKVAQVRTVRVPGQGRMAGDDVIDVDGHEVRNPDDDQPRLPN